MHSRPRKKGLVDESAESHTHTDHRRSSGRIRELSKRVKTLDAEQREEIKQNAKNARLESLENDNYQEEAVPEDDEFVIEDDDDLLLSKRKKKARKTAREMFKDAKKKKFVAKNFNTVLEEAALDTFPPHFPSYLTVAAAPSMLPQRHFCSVCGYFANYTCTQCGSRFCSVRCNSTHKETRCMKFIA